LNFLAEQFPVSRERRLPEAARERVLQMERDQFSVASAALGEIQATLGDFLSSTNTGSSARNSGLNWQESAMQFQPRANMIASQEIELFSSHLGPTSAEQVNAQLAVLQKNLRQE
jgi:hypothetical protein